MAGARGVVGGAGSDARGGGGGRLSMEFGLIGSETNRALGCGTAKVTDASAACSLGATAGRGSVAGVVIDVEAAVEAAP